MNDGIKFCLGEHLVVVRGHMIGIGRRSQILAAGFCQVQCPNVILDVVVRSRNAVELLTKL